MQGKEKRRLRGMKGGREVRVKGRKEGIRDIDRKKDRRQIEKEWKET